MNNKVNIVTFFNAEDFEDLLTEFCEVNNLSVLVHEEREANENEIHKANVLGIIIDDEDSETQP